MDDGECVVSGRDAASAGTPTTEPWHPDFIEDIPQHGAVIALLAADDNRRQETVNGVVDFRRQPATGAADAMTGRLDLIEGKSG